MLTTRKRPELDQADTAKPAGFRVRNGRVNINQQLIVALATLAKIPSSKAKDFDIFDVLTNWLHFASGKINQPAELELLNSLIHAASELHRLVQRLEDDLAAVSLQRPSDRVLKVDRVGQFGKSAGF